MVVNRVVLFICYCCGLKNTADYLLQKFFTNTENEIIYQFSPFGANIWIVIPDKLEEIIFI